ncbi:MAG: hypothetical protein V5A62_05840 [Haloarculaceae archaeon]
MSHDLVFRHATELARDVRRGALSPVEVVETFLERARPWDDRYPPRG